MVSLHGGSTMDSERRKHKRIPLKFTVLCQKVGLSDGRLYSGNTVNVSPGGMLVEVNQPHLRDGELVSIEMTVPPTEGLLEYGGRFSSYARIIRVINDIDSTQSCSLGNVIAMEFCESPRLRV